MTLRELALFLAHEGTQRPFSLANLKFHHVLYPLIDRYPGCVHLAAVKVYPELKSAVEEIRAWIAITEHSRDIPIDKIVSSCETVDVQKIREMADVIARKNCSPAFYYSQVF